MSSIKAVAIMSFLGSVASYPTMHQPPAVHQTPVVKEAPAVQQTQAVQQPPAVEEPPAMDQPPAVEVQASGNTTAARRTLWPLTNYGGIGSKPDPALYESEELFWGDGTAFSNMTCAPKDDNKMLNMARLGDWVKSLDCSKNALDVGFESSDAMNKAKSAWQWVTKDPDNAAVVVVDGTKCGGPNRRQPYLIQKISYDEKSQQATLSGKATKWDEVMMNAAVQISSSYPASSGLDKRQETSGSVDLAQTFNLNIAEIAINDNARVRLDCVDCRTTGRVDFTANLDVGFLPPKLDVSATLTTRDGVGINLGLGLTLEADITGSLDFNKELLSVPLAGFDIPGVTTLAPLLSINAGGSIGPVTASIEAQFGGAITAADDRTLRIGDGDSDKLDFQFTPQDPTLSGSVELTANIGPVYIAAFEASAFGLAGSFGIDLKAPTLDARAAIEASSDLGVCDDPNAAAGATLSANAGVSFGIFGGLGKAEELPNEIVIAEVNQELFSKCFPFGQVDGGDDPAGPGAPEGDGAQGRDITKDSSENVSNFDGNDGKRPFVGRVNYANTDGNNGASLWFNANDVVLLSPLNEGDTIVDVSLMAEVNPAAKCTLFDSFDQAQGADGCGNLANPITPDLTPGAAPIAIDGKTHLCARCEGL
ncbi:hypothetical protein ACHAPJ_012085 [Fusarium lateritium]